MKKWGICLVFLTFPVWAQSFLPGTEDIPLMPELKRVEETASFDKPSERLVLISAETTSSSKKITQFYQKTMTNLGWETKDGQTFQRGNDTFVIEIIPTSKINQVQFRLSQKNL